MIAGGNFLRQFALPPGFARRKKKATSRSGYLLPAPAGSGEYRCFAALARYARLHRAPLSLRPRLSCRGDASPPAAPQTGACRPKAPAHPRRGVDARVSAGPRMNGAWAGAFAVAPLRAWLTPTARRPRGRLSSGPWAAGRLTPGRCSRRGLDAPRAALLDAGSHRHNRAIASGERHLQGQARCVNTRVCIGWTLHPHGAHNGRCTGGRKGARRG